MSDDVLLLGIDLGTTAVKSALYRPDGSAVASASREYELSTPTPETVEVDPDVYWDALRATTGSLLRQPSVDARRIVALAISAQGETLVPVGADGAALRPAIVWLDNRASVEADELADRFGNDRIYEITGQPEMVATWPAAKVLWIARHEPDVHARAVRYLLIEDHVLHRLTGEYVCEPSLVTSTCYWDFRATQWWPEMIDACELDIAQLPALVQSGTPVGTLTPTAAASLGLHPRTTVVAGGLDQACGAIGVGNVRPGRFSENTGAAVALCATVDTLRLDPDRVMPVHHHALPGTYMFHTFTSGGIVLRWFRDQFGDRAADGGDGYEALVAAAATTPPGADGLVVLPHLQGAMAPESNQHARGVVAGLSLTHGRAHLTRAILESIAYVVRRNIDVVERLGMPVETIYASGGGARSDTWKQIEADVTQRPVTVTAEPDAGTLGAAILAGVGAGIFPDAVVAADAMVTTASIFEPRPSLAAVYDDLYRAYGTAYEALCPTFDLLASRVVPA